MKYIKESREWQEDRQLEDFISFCHQQLGWTSTPNIHISDDHGEAQFHKSMGYFNPKENRIWVLRGSRVRADWYRTLAHELVHHTQRDRGQQLDGADGSAIENEANSLAGILLREWGRRNPTIFS